MEIFCSLKPHLKNEHIILSQLLPFSSLPEVPHLLLLKSFLSS